MPSFESASSAYQKEAARWDRPKRDGGMRPDTFQEYPRMVYKARKKPSGGPFLVVDPGDETFSAQNCLTVGNERELDHAIEHGWRLTPQEATDHALALEDAVSTAAAERHASDRKLSEKAQAEAAAADAATPDHLPEVPVSRTAKRRSGS
jgi:hypothetical protein